MSEEPVVGEDDTKGTRCNGRKKGRSDLPKQPPGPWAGPGYCKQRVDGRCKHHGGNAAKGLAHPNHKHGRYSKVLPSDLRERFEAALEDEEYMSLRDEIGLTQARMSELLEQLGEGGVAASIETLEEGVQKFEAGQDAEDPELKREGVRKIMEGAQALRSHRATWSQLEDLIDLRGRLVDKERRRAEMLAQFLQRDQFLGIVDRLGLTVKNALEKHIDDDKKRRAVLSELTNEVETIFDG